MDDSKQSVHSQVQRLPIRRFAAPRHTRTEVLTLPHPAVACRLGHSPRIHIKNQPITSSRDLDLSTHPRLFFKLAAYPLTGIVDTIPELYRRLGSNHARIGRVRKTKVP